MEQVNMTAEQYQQVQALTKDGMKPNEAIDVVVHGKTIESKDTVREAVKSGLCVIALYLAVVAVVLFGAILYAVAFAT